MATIESFRGLLANIVGQSRGIFHPESEASGRKSRRSPPACGRGKMNDWLESNVRITVPPCKIDGVLLDPERKRSGMVVTHPLLLFGLFLVAIPVILHLLMRTKPKKLLFPALRLIQNRKRTNTRRM